LKRLILPARITTARATSADSAGADPESAMDVPRETGFS
jgi:hypothetical protein